MGTELEAGEAVHKLVEGLAQPVDDVIVVVIVVRELESWRNGRGLCKEEARVRARGCWEREGKVS